MTESSFPDDFPRTARLLDTIVRPEGRIRPVEQREELFDRVIDDRFFSRLYRYLKGLNLTLSDWAGEAWRRHVIRIAVNRAEMKRIFPALRDRGVRAAVMKGEPLSRQIYGSPHLRSSADIDLLVVSAARCEAGEVLSTQLGYEQVSQYLPWASNQIRYLHSERSTVVEIHWLMESPHVPVPSTERVLRERAKVECGDLVVPVLPPPFDFLGLCYHFHRHRGGFKNLLDIAGWLDRFASEMNWGELFEITDRLGVNGIVAWPLRTLDRFLGSSTLSRAPYSGDVATGLLARWTAGRLRRRFVELAEPAISEDTAAWKLRRLAESVFRMGALDGLAQKLTGMLRPVFLGPHPFGRTVGPLIQRAGGRTVDCT